MASDVERPSAAMEAGGFYNKYSLIPSEGGAPALPYLGRAVADVPLEPIDEPVVIADYGSSQGLNSLAPMRLAIESVRRRSSADRPIRVYHVDQPSNDFNSLFELLDQSPDRFKTHRHWRESTRCSFARCLRRHSPRTWMPSELATRAHRPLSQIV
jgi:SAM dependent carboxyl methyltransferase